MNNKLRQAVMALSLIPGLAAPVSSAIASTSNDVIMVTDQEKTTPKGLTNKELDAMAEEQERRYQKALADIKKIKENLGETRNILCPMLDEIDIFLSGKKDKEGNRFPLGEVPEQCKKDGPLTN